MRYRRTSTRRSSVFSSIALPGPTTASLPRRGGGAHAKINRRAEASRHGSPRCASPCAACATRLSSLQQLWRAGEKLVGIKNSSSPRYNTVLWHGDALQPLLLSTGLVALAEMGDKTQLLSLVLAARLR